MMSYKIKKFALIGAIILVLCLLVGVLVWSSVNSDVVSAYYFYDDNSSQSVAFPFNQINTLCNFNALNFFYSNLSISSDFVVNYSGDYYYNLVAPKNDYTIDVNTSSLSLNVNSVDIPFVYHFSYDDGSTTYYTYYQHGVYFDFVAGSTYYINFAFNKDVDYLGSALELFYFANSDGWDASGTTLNSILNDSNYKEYNDFIFVSIPITCSENYNRLIFCQRFNYCTYYLTVTDSPSFNSTGFFNVKYSATMDTTYLDNNFALNTVFVNQDDLFFTNLFNSIDNNNISIFLNADTGSFTDLYFNIKNLQLVSNTLDERCYSSTTYDNTNTFYVVLDLYMYSSQYGNNALVYNFYDSSGNSISTIISIDFDFTFANNNVDNYQLGYLAGLADGKEYNHYTYYNAGYSIGYNDGLETADNGSFIGLMSAVIESPLNAVLSIFDVEILGYNMKSLYMSLLSIALILFVIKFILGHIGGSSD